MQIENKIQKAIAEIIYLEFGQDVDRDNIALNKTREDFEGDFTFVVFPYLKFSGKPPEQTAEIIGKGLVERVLEVESYNIIKGFLNIELTTQYWLNFLKSEMDNTHYGIKEITDDDPVVVEFSSPNTNKPLHLGHIRNNLLGYSVAKILEADGKKVYKVNLVNDRGIHICKSMLAWMKYGDGETPQKYNKKGDKLVGDYYVKFETELKKQVKNLMLEKSLCEEDARKMAPLMQEAQMLLVKWEKRDPKVMEVWEKMNSWVYDGFEKTYKRLGVDFDKVYFESQTYLLGKDIVKEGLEKGVFNKEDDGSVWVDLSDENLDKKLLLRSDGTSVYMTQDLGTAQLRYDDFKPGEMIYVVGNEQNYHFSVLEKILKKLHKPYADSVHHLSYGMVELPEGKMKSREGTVVDADDLMDEMVSTAQSITEVLGKIDEFNEDEKEKLFHTIGLGALKYFMLKVDPKKNMLFNPAESIDFNGNTGPFIQYTHARICSILRTVGNDNLKKIKLSMPASKINYKEKVLLKTIYDFPAVITDAANSYSPAVIANYAYDLCKDFNQFYHDYSILNEPDSEISDFRIKLAQLTAHAIKTGMSLLGIDVPEKM